MQTYSLCSFGGERDSHSQTTSGRTPGSKEETRVCVNSETYAPGKYNDHLEVAAPHLNEHFVDNEISVMGERLWLGNFFSNSL